jgi:hypothetical protein
MVTLELIQFLLPLPQQGVVEVHVKEEALEQVVQGVVELMIQMELQVQLTKDSLERMDVAVELTSVEEVVEELAKLETPTELDMEVME